MGAPKRQVHGAVVRDYGCDVICFVCDVIWKGSCRMRSPGQGGAKPSAGALVREERTQTGGRGGAGAQGPEVEAGDVATSPGALGPGSWREAGRTPLGLGGRAARPHLVSEPREDELLQPPGSWCCPDGHRNLGQGLPTHHAGRTRMAEPTPPARRCPCTAPGSQS